MSLIREHIIKRFTRSSGWSKVRKIHIKLNGWCRCCGKEHKLEVHHIEDFSTYPKKELLLSNLITLCKRCHLLFGHLNSWKSINPNVKSDSDLMYIKIRTRRK